VWKGKTGVQAGLLSQVVRQGRR